MEQGFHIVCSIQYIELSYLTIHPPQPAARENAFVQAFFVIGERLIFVVPQATTIILLTHSMGSSFFGKYVLVLTWIAVFQAAANFGVSEYLAREIGREPHQGPRYFRHSLVLVAALSSIAMAVMAVAAWAARYPSDVASSILLAIVSLFPASIVATCRGVLLANQKAEYMIGLALVESLILLPLNIYWILTEAGLLPFVFTIVLAKVVTGLLALKLVQRFVTPFTGQWDRTFWGQLWKAVLPFGLSGLVVFPSIRFDIFLLSKMATFETLGLYSAASKLMELLFVLPMAFFMVMLPQTARDFSGLPAQRTERLEHSLKWYFAIVIPVGIGVIGFAEPVIVLIYGNTFTDAALILQIQMLAFLLLTMDVVLAMICKAAGFQRADLGFVLTSAGFNIILNVLLIPGLMAVGSALALVLSSAIGLILRWRFAVRFVVKLRWLAFLKTPVVLAFLLLAICIPLEPWISWPVLAVGYVMGYGALLVTRSKLESNAAEAALRRGRMK